MPGLLVLRRRRHTGAQLETWIDAHLANGDHELRLGGVALGDMPCLYWPSLPGEVERPEPILDPPYPTFVLTSDTDPATPTVNAMRVSVFDDAYLITLQGGPHVIFDWGYTCVDDLISNYLGSGTLPPTKVTICDGDIIDPYVAAAPAETADVEAAEPVDVAASVADQLSYNVEYWSWPGDETLEFGCDFGGSGHLRADRRGNRRDARGMRVHRWIPGLGDGCLRRRRDPESRHAVAGR